MRLKKGACSSIGILLLLVFLFVYFQNNTEVSEATEATVRIGKYFIIFTWKQFLFQTIAKHSYRDSKTFSLLNCNCSRTLFNVETDNSVQFSQTTCGGDAFQRGANQKVVGFSFYGDSSSELHQFRKYFDGIEENLRLVRSHYGPDWSMRLYYDLETTEGDIARLSSHWSRSIKSVLSLVEMASMAFMNVKDLLKGALLP